ncbi:hypothetical protein [Kosmotoga pacifica]|uniref:Uncharacterized protein n=1 Tax=Kosmotoga pacifica TaxID=1330330 RepID=A0A0G2Z8V0_9BACT|nr:hypothetical protein [Kosmotoga pacifica]AKI97987.1 hypothetical protein IX53_09300 [Kosmotoga pacifica]
MSRLKSAFALLIIFVIVAFFSSCSVEKEHPTSVGNENYVPIKIESINPESKNYRIFVIDQLKICVHSIEVVNDYTIVDISFIQNYTDTLVFAGSNIFLKSDEGIFSALPEPGIKNLQPKYLNALFLRYYEDDLPGMLVPVTVKHFSGEVFGNSLVRGYLVFPNNNSVANLKLIIDISLQYYDWVVFDYVLNKDFEDIFGRYELDISGIKEPADNCPLKLLLVHTNYYEGINSLEVELQNISDKAIKALSLIGTFYNDFGDVYDSNVSYIAQKLNISPGETRLFAWAVNDIVTKAEVEIDEIVFMDGQKWSREEEHK